MDQLRVFYMIRAGLHACLFLAAAWTVSFGGVWAGEIPRAEHPRPELRRETWMNLNGSWQFRFDPEDRGLTEKWWAGEESNRAGFDRRIVVPFCWESRLSGIADTGGQKIGWYRRTLDLPDSWKAKHVWLRFGAVDWQARVWVNGKEAGRHEGGYTPFEFDITGLVEAGRPITIVVRAFDPTDRELPLGKQTKKWYTSTSGIWQTVWLEARPAQYVHLLRMIPRRVSQSWSLDVELEAAGTDGPVQLEFSSPQGAFPKHQASLTLKGGRGRLERLLEIPSAKPWSPEDPHLYDLDVRLLGKATDTVHTYFGLRTIERGKYGELPGEVFLLNGEPVYLRGALDQSFNPEGICTAPSEAFIRRDLQIAKSLGLNFLRIHVKSEEPRRLYWADRLGMLLMADMPCTYEQTPRARQAWERTMRATIRRDRNHPAIIAWCLFNETWGLGGSKYRHDRETQDWVLRMWTEVKEQLDPSRLVEDNSANRGDHVKTDINSWHFYIDDCAEARRHIAGMVKNTRPGSPTNYVPTRSQAGEPLLVSEYGAVAARDGDRDVSWGFRCLTTQLRRHEMIQGYVYTQLTDVEWEHNGLVNYDRSAKEFGYNGFVPGMSVADLQQADFIGFDAPPVFEIGPGDKITVPVFVSHFSRRRGEPSLRWHVTGTDNLGRRVATDWQTQPVVWEPYRVTFQQPLRIGTPTSRPFVGAIVLELIDKDDKRIAANFVGLIARPASTSGPAGEPSSRKARSPRVEVLGPRLVALRIAPGSFASFRADTSAVDWFKRPDKFCATGSCEVEYRIALPLLVREAIPAKIVLIAELATRSDHQRLDWPSVRRRPDCPQTDQRKYPGAVSIRVLGEELWRLELPDDPADSRGILSHYEGYEHGSYGYLIRKSADFTRNVSLREQLRSEKPFPVVFRAVGEREGEGHGLSIFGERLGRYPVDPMLIIQTARDLARPVGWTSTRPVTVDCLLDEARTVEAIRSGESGGHQWQYTTEKPAADWTKPAMDDSSWKVGRSGFGKRGTPGIRIGIPWTSRDIWLRTEMEMPGTPIGMAVRYFHCGDAKIYVNGKQLLAPRGCAEEYRELPLGKAQMELFRKGRNTIAVHCRKTDGSQGVDLGIRWIGPKK